MKTWVLLRGLMRETRHWGRFVPQLQAHFPDDQIICIEWPGNGALNQQQSYRGIEQMARYCQQTLTQKGHTGPYHVVAISLGAMVALEWAYQHPEKLASCTLINTSLRQHSPFYQRLIWRQWSRLLRLLMLPSAAREREILSLTSYGATEQIVQQWQHYAAQYPISQANILRQLWAACCYRGGVKAPSVPILLLNSLADQLVDPRCSQHIAQAWGCPLHSHPSAGHDLPMDAPDWVIQQISSSVIAKCYSSP